MMINFTSKHRQHEKANISVIENKLLINNAVCVTHQYTLTTFSMTRHLKSLQELYLLNYIFTVIQHTLNTTLSKNILPTISNNT